MATYFTDFSEYSTGSAPSDWTVSGSGTVTVETGGADKVLKINLTSSDQQTHATWNDIDSDSTRADAEVLIKFQVGNVGNGTSAPLVGCTSRANTDVDGYIGGLRTNTAVRVYSVANSAQTTIASATISTVSTGTWYWMRFRNNSTALKLRIWADGAGEPGTWDIDTTNGTYTAAGSVGVMGQIGSTTDPLFDQIGIGTNGDTAPNAAGGGGQSVAPSTGHAIYAGKTASISQPITVAPPTGHAVVLGRQPSVSQSVAIAPSTGHAVAAGYAPVIAQPISVAPTAGHAVVTGKQPNISQSATVRPDAGHVVATGRQPTIAQPITVAPTAGHAVAAGKQPSVEQPTGIAPSTGHIHAAGYALVLSQPRAVALGATAHAIVVGRAPAVSQSVAISPSKGAIIVRGLQATIQQPRTIAAGAAARAIVLGRAPFVQQGFGAYEYVRLRSVIARSSGLDSAIARSVGLESRIDIEDAS